MARPNLQVHTRAFVRRVLFNNTRDPDGSIRAIGVEYEMNGRVQQVYATREVILSAGKVVLLIANIVTYKSNSILCRLYKLATIVDALR